MDNRRTYEERMRWLRDRVEALSALPDIVCEAGWNVAEDGPFWDQLDHIEAAGRQRDTSRALWLAEFTQVDDLGPMGRALFLARAALIALAEMPEAALSVAKFVASNLPEDASAYRKVGVCKLLLASGSPEALPLLERYVNAPEYVRAEAVCAIEQLRNK